MRLRVVLTSALLAAAPAARPAEPQFWKLQDARTFLEGEAEGVSVDSDGHLRLAPDARALFDPEAPYEVGS